jgi:hypothetical protein
MKALIQKDLRENLKVAVIGLLIFSLLLIQAYQTCLATLTNLITRNMSGQMNALQPLLAQSLLIEATFFCGLFGAALGWLQTRNEAHRDLWAFLIHRPITRTEIFWGKTLAGLCLYLFGAGLPLVVLVAVVRTPGHVAAPFEWAMLGPVVSIFLTGGAYYFAGVLTGLRQARWYGSRGLGLGLAIAGSASVFAAMEFWQSLALIALVVLILATAVWGSYQSGGYYRGQAVTGRLALIAAMTAGCGAVLLAGMGLLFTLIFNPLSHHSFVYSYYQMDRVGTLYRGTMRDNELVEITDLDGHPLLNPKTGQKMDRQEFQKRVAYGVVVNTTLKDRRPSRNAIEDAAHFFSLWNVTDKTLWFLDRHGKLLGFDGRTRKFVGSLQPHGADGTTLNEPFLLQPNAYYYYNGYNEVTQKLLPSAKTVYQVDFRDRTVKPIFTVANDDEIGGYANDQYGYDEFQAKNFLITTRHTVCLLDSNGKTILNVPYQPAFFEYPTVQLSSLVPSTTNANRYAIWFEPDYQMNWKSGWKMPTHIQWLGSDQAVTRSLALPTLHQTTEESWTDKLATALVPLPLHVKLNQSIYGPWNLFSFALALLCAAIGATLARRYNFATSAVIGWTLFIFLLGIAGLLTFFCVQEWPAREACPGCKKLRAVDREACEHCDAEFPPPEKNGTEIFAPLVKV